MGRRSWVGVLVGLATCMLAAPGFARTGGASVAPEGTPAPKLVLNLLSNGKAPLRTLRYVPALQATSARYTLTNRIGTEILAEGHVVRSVQQPGYWITFKEAPLAPKSGVAEWVVESGDLIPDNAMGEEQKKAAADRMMACRGTRVAFQVDARGLPVTLVCTPSERAVPAITSSLKELLESFKTLVLPLPAEAVGVGARWEVVVPLQQNGVTTVFQVQYELKEVVDQVIEVSATMRLKLDPKSYPTPFPEAFASQATGLALVFTSDIRQSLIRTMPERATFCMHVLMDTQVEVEGVKHDITGRTRMDLMWEQAPERAGRTHS